MPRPDEDRTVVVELKVRMLRQVPVNWSQDQIDFWLNESSHCLGSEIQDLAESDGAEDGSCDTCHRAEAHYLRDATPEDLERLKLRAAPGQIIDVEPIVEKQLLEQAALPRPTE